MFSIEEFPDEIVVMIVLYLEPCDLLLFNQVCWRWYRIGHDEKVIEWQDIPRYLDKSMKQNFILLQSYSSIYPGIEEYLDLFHCLGRAISRQHLPAFLYFIKKVNNENFDVDEFATLFDLLANHWHDEIFVALVKRYLSLYRQYYHISLFEKLDPIKYKPCLIGLPTPIKTTRGQNFFKRATLIQDYSFSFPNLKSSLRAGRKRIIQDKSYRDFTDEIKKLCSYELRMMIEKLA